MTKRQHVHQLMHHSVINFLANSNHIWGSKTPLVSTFTELEALVREIDDISLNQEKFSTRGYTAQKKADREHLIKISYSIVIKLKAMAKFNKNKLAEKEIDYSLSQLERLRDAELVHHCSLIQSKGQQYLTEAEVFELTQSILTSFEKAINAYKPKITERDAIGDKKTLATADLTTLFTEVLTKLDLLDSLVEAIITDDSFINGYKQARKVERINVPKKGTEVQ